MTDTHSTFESLRASLAEARQLVRELRQHPEGTAGAAGPRLAQIEQALDRGHESVQLAEQQGRAALRSIEVRYEALIEHTPIAIFINRGDRVTFVNEACRQLFGADTRELLLGRSAYELFAADYHDVVRERIRTLHETGTPAPLVHEQIVRIDGRSVDVEVAASTFDDDAGRAIHVMLVDISERLRSEAELRSACDHLAAVIEACPAAVFSMDREGRVTSWNPGAERLFGWSAAEATGGRLPIVREEELGEFQQLCARVLDGSRIEGVELTRRRKDGTNIEVSLSAGPVRSRQNDVVGIMGTVVDITERKHAEAALHEREGQLRSAQKMEAIGRLAGGIAHDFNNLLSVIISYAGFAANALAPSDPCRTDIQEVIKAGERAATLTRQLLAFSRRQVLQPENVSLNQIVRSMEDMLGRVIGEDIELVTELAPDLSNVRADPGQIEQVIMNLVANARDAMPDGGTLTIATANTEARPDSGLPDSNIAPGPYIRLCVTDTGHGMDAATVARLFEPFFTTKEPGKGTGLGLATVYGIVKQSGGYVTAQSEPGHGASFCVCLPAQPMVSESEKRRKRADAQHAAGETILVVEDELAVRRLAKRILASAGYSVVVAAGGAEALSICERQGNSIHLLLTDVVMPQMSGKQLADRVGKLYPAIRVLFMSGYTEDDIVHHGVLDPGTHFIGKPFNAGELARKVREVLDEARDRNPHAEPQAAPPSAAR